MITPFPRELFTNVYVTPAAINDHTLIHDGARWHLFHIWMVKERDHLIGHATSTDLRNWDPQPDVLPKGEEPSWENNPGGNAPYVFAQGGKYHLFYSRYDSRPHPDPFFNPLWHDALQHIGVATSVDLFRWEKYAGNPIFHPAPSWSPWEDFESDQCRPHCCRDPHVLQIGKQFVLYYVAMAREPNISAVACAVSEDLIHWQDKGPVTKKPIVWRGTGTCESPCVVQVDSRWHLFFKHGKWTHHGISDNPFDFPVTAPLVDCHAAEIFQANGQWCITHSGSDGLGLAKLDFKDGRPQVSRWA